MMRVATCQRGVLPTDMRALAWRQRARQRSHVKELIAGQRVV
jgi:hypothetical protein